MAKLVQKNRSRRVGSQEALEIRELLKEYKISELSTMTGRTTDTIRRISKMTQEEAENLDQYNKELDAKKIAAMISKRH